MCDMYIYMCVYVYVVYKFICVHMYVHMYVCTCPDSDPSASHKLWKEIVSQVCLGFGSVGSRDNPILDSELWSRDLQSKDRVESGES